MYCVQQYYLCHDDVIKWKHFPRHWPFVRGIHRSPLNSPHKGQWRGALMFPLICVWINSWVNNREAGDLRRYRTHYDVTVMCDMRVPIPVRSQCMGLTYINKCLAKVLTIQNCQHFCPKIVYDTKSTNGSFFTHCGRMTHICVSELAIIGSDNGLSPGRRQAIIWTNDGILLIGPLGTNFNEILFGIQTFPFNKMHLKMPSARWRPFCVGLNVLILSKYTVVTSDICSHNQLGCLQWIFGIHGLPETILVHCSQKMYVITLAVRLFCCLYTVPIF